MKLLREPLLHFLVAGGLLFAAYAWLHRGGAEGTAPTAVRITPAEVAWLQETWTRQWKREPTREELRGLVTDFLKEELLAREARAMHLDEDDTIVRRRLAQKVAFLVEDTARLAEPTVQDLERFYRAHPEHFTNEARVSFTHIYFSREKRADAETDAKAALVELAHGADPATLGDRLLVDAEMRDADERAITAQLGPDFARAVLALPPGAWSGPIQSGYGLHLVWVTEQTPARQRAFADVKAQVLERWRDEQQRESSARYFASLLKKYGVTVDASVQPLIGPLDAPSPAPPSGEEGIR
jgi:hypothetical protein